MRSDGRTGYSRLKGREYTAGISIFGEAIWCKLPKTAELTKLDDRWRIAIWLGKSDRSDEHVYHRLGDWSSPCKVSPAYYCLDADSMAAMHGDDIFVDGEPEELDRLDEVLKRT